MGVSFFTNKYHIRFNKLLNASIRFYMVVLCLKCHCKSKKCKLLEEHAALLPNVVVARHRCRPVGGTHNAQIAWESHSTDEIAEASAASEEEKYYWDPISNIPPLPGLTGIYRASGKTLGGSARGRSRGLRPIPLGMTHFSERATTPFPGRSKRVGRDAQRVRGAH